MSRKKFEREELAFIGRVNAVFLSDELSFEEAVREYRNIEAEFVKRSGDNEYRVVETRRRITEWLLTEALGYEQPHEVCREIWQELVQRGFSDIQKRYSMTGIYARCCQMNGEFDAGLAVIEPLIAESEQALADPTLTPNRRLFYEDELATDCKIRDELKAGFRGEEDEDLETRPQRDPEEIAFRRQSLAIYWSDRSFEESVRESRRMEAEFVERAGDNEDRVVAIRRRITEQLLRVAHRDELPHEVCREIWHELLQRGFSDTGSRYWMSRLYAQCCQRNGEFDAGLAVIEPLIVESEQALADPTLPADQRGFYEDELAADRKIRDELKAGIRG